MEIRRRWAAGDSTATLVDRYSVRASTISDIAHGRTYKYLPIIHRPSNFVPRGGKKKLTERDVAEARWRLGTGETQVQVAARFGISTTQIGRIARVEAWKHVEPLSPVEMELAAAD